MTYVNLYVPPTEGEEAGCWLYDVSEGYLSTVFRVIDAHVDKYPTSSIVVHDIYSFDLSLYLIARYLVHHSMPTLSLAFQLVSASRPPGISHAPFVKTLYEAGEEEVEWDLGVLERPTWMRTSTGNWTWSGVGERGEKRLQSSHSGEGEHKQAEGKVEEKKEEGARPAGTIRRKEKKKPPLPSPLPSSSTSSTSPSPAPSSTASSPPSWHLRSFH